MVKKMIYLVQRRSGPISIIASLRGPGMHNRYEEFLYSFEYAHPTREQAEAHEKELKAKFPQDSIWVEEHPSID